MRPKFVTWNNQSCIKHEVQSVPDGLCSLQSHQTSIPVVPWLIDTPRTFLLRSKLGRQLLNNEPSIYPGHGRHRQARWCPGQRAAGLEGRLPDPGSDTRCELGLGQEARRQVLEHSPHPGQSGRCGRYLQAGREESHGRFDLGRVQCSDSSDEQDRSHHRRGAGQVYGRPRRQARREALRLLLRRPRRRAVHQQPDQHPALRQQAQRRAPPHQRGQGDGHGVDYSAPRGVYGELRRRVCRQGLRHGMETGCQVAAPAAHCHGGHRRLCRKVLPSAAGVRG